MRRVNKTEEDTGDPHAEVRFCVARYIQASVLLQGRNLKVV
ncbi:hypothetical protein MtrunA17_Chr7g0227811 [Medicago truncatula]|nr:hypothetical protein MtrunA17_Chr7g0227811 [Medicago truncatula]